MTNKNKTEIMAIRDYINWRKTYSVRTPLGSFRFYCTHHKDGSYHGLVWYFSSSGEWSKGQTKEFNIKEQLFFGNSEDMMMENAEDWIRGNVHPDATLELVETVE